MVAKQKIVKHFLEFPRKTLFVFFALLVFSVGVFVSADTEFSSGQSLFLDVDQDGLSDKEERVFGTDSTKKDTDGDGYSDGVEIESGYDPLKPAPGDKLVAEDSGLGKGGYDESGDTLLENENLTQNASDEIADILAKSSQDTSGVNMNDLNASIEALLQQSTVEVEMPEVDVNAIKIKRLKCKSSHEDDEKCIAKKKEVTLEYLTVLSYLVANNSPIPLKSEGDLGTISDSLLNDATLAFTTGNFGLLKDTSERADTFLKALRDIEVPENMLEIHAKALQLGLFTQKLGKEFANKSNDPIAQIALLAQLQGVINIVSEFSTEVAGQLAVLGIKEIPVDL